MSVEEKQAELESALCAYGLAERQAGLHGEPAGNAVTVQLRAEALAAARDLALAVLEDMASVPFMHESEVPAHRAKYLALRARIAALPAEAGEGSG